jgi:hypothetical protein
LRNGLAAFWFRSNLVEVCVPHGLQSCVGARPYSLKSSSVARPGESLCATEEGYATGELPVAEVAILVERPCQKRVSQSNGGTNTTANRRTPAKSSVITVTRV